MTPEEKRAFNQRFSIFKQKLTLVGKLKPREEYLYPVMRSVPFRDTETRLEMALIEFGDVVQRAQQKQKAAERKR
jgi:hypothetical protein